jgi:DNA-binding transcriptional MerR regulator
VLALKTFYHNALSPYDVEYVDQAEFSAGEAFAVSGVNQKLQTHWRGRGLLLPIPGRGHARFLIDEVVRMTIMQRLSESGISVKRLRSLTSLAAHHATAKLMAMPGAVAIKAESAEAEAQEVERIEAWAARNSERYVFMPLPERDDLEGRIAQYFRADLSDLHELVDQDGLFHGLLIDLEAVAKLVHSRAKLPLETHVVSARLADGGAE